MDEVRRLRVGDIEIEWQEAGRGERPFVLVHGFTGSRLDFADVLPELGAHGRTLAPDQRGHGGTTNPGTPAGYTFEQLVADLLGLLDAARIRHVDLLGHSMGGMVALRAALAAPERVASLVLMDTTPGPVDVLPPAVIAVASKLAREQGTGALVPLMRQAAATDPSRPPSSRRAEATLGTESYWARIQRKMDAMDPEAFAALAPLLGDHASVAHRLGEIRCPVTVIVGEEDQPFREPARLLARGIAGAALAVLPDAGHNPQLENRDAWLREVRGHLDRVRPSPRTPAERRRRATTARRASG